ncbi:RtcB family protein [Candidatus Electronema sp. PJ]|uniref:RtcB family protein n=1 Tax=Candidatus Electronema sp. PJ TaxID=3401572 RepID=UPI003AA9D42A
MKQIIDSERRPIKLWLDDIEATALAQARNLANHPFTFSHVAIMPDAHAGYGMPIGGVLACDGAVICNAVGVDIGCGMCAEQTSLSSLDRETLKKILGLVRTAVPVGFDHHKQQQERSLLPDLARLDQVEKSIVREQFQAGCKQIGTLGGGNHFIEIQQGDDGHVWLMIHSGSRNLGLKVAEYYNRLAGRLNEEWGSLVPKQWQLAYLPLETQEAQDYLAEMHWCVDFALASRKLMMERLKEAVQEVVGEVAFLHSINKAHNYAAMEEHFGKEVLIHRKGATRARAGEYGIIPGSQGSRSFIVLGKGNAESYASCSHGAGRRMGRGQAQRELDLAAEVERLNAMGVVHAVRNQKDLDEAPGSYKDIESVMANQTDLVEIAVSLLPLAVIKG